MYWATTKEKNKIKEDSVLHYPHQQNQNTDNSDCCVEFIFFRD